MTDNEFKHQELVIAEAIMNKLKIGYDAIKESHKAAWELEKRLRELRFEIGTLYEESKIAFELLMNAT